MTQQDISEQVKELTEIRAELSASIQHGILRLTNVKGKLVEKLVAHNDESLIPMVDEIDAAINKYKVLVR